jgi:hypothetical protein
MYVSEVEASSGRNGTTAMKLDTALRGVAEFLKTAQFSAAGSEIPDRDRLSGFALSDKDRAAYGKCLHNLVLVFETTNSFNRRSLDELLSHTVKEAYAASDPLGHIPDAVIKRCRNDLKKALTSIKTYLVYLPVVGVDQKSLPSKVGSLEFFPGDGDNIATIKNAMFANIMSLKNNEAQKEQMKQLLISDVDDYLSDKAIVEVEVHAGDHESALDKAFGICRQGLDVVNFFADLIVGKDLGACAALVGEGNSVASPAAPKSSVRFLMSMREKIEGDLGSIAYKEREISEVHRYKRPSGPLLGVPLPKASSVGSNDPVSRAFARVSKLVGNDAISTMEKRVLTAFQWAGRATVAIRKEEAFLLYMIALESLILGRKEKPVGEIVFQFRLKTAHLLRRTPSERKALMERLDALYEVRSGVVHSGLFQVSDTDLAEARQYAKEALLIVSNDTPFQDMTDATQFKDWLNDRLISSSGDDATFADGNSCDSRPVGDEVGNGQ